MSGTLQKPITAIIELTRRVDPEDSQGILSTAVYRLKKMRDEGKCQAWRVVSKEGVELAKG